MAEDITWDPLGPGTVGPIDFVHVVHVHLVHVGSLSFSRDSRDSRARFMDYKVGPVINKLKHLTCTAWSACPTAMHFCGRE